MQDEKSGWEDDFDVDAKNGLSSSSPDTETNRSNTNQDLFSEPSKVII